MIASFLKDLSQPEYIHVLINPLPVYGLAMGIVGLIIWIAIAFWPARVAARKGHSAIRYFILSLAFFPLALIMAYMVQHQSGFAVA